MIGSGPVATDPDRVPQECFSSPTSPLQQQAPPTHHRWTKKPPCAMHGDRGLSGGFTRTFFVRHSTTRHRDLISLQEGSRQRNWQALVRICRRLTRLSALQPRQRGQWYRQIFGRRLDSTLSRTSYLEVLLPPLRLTSTDLSLPICLRRLDTSRDLQRIQ